MSSYRFLFVLAKYKPIVTGDEWFINRRLLATLEIMLRNRVGKQFPEFAKRGLFNSGDIGSADPKAGGYLPLGLFPFSADPVPAADDLIFPICEGILQMFHQKLYLFPHQAVFCYIYRWTFQDIQQADLVALFICSDGFIEGDFPSLFLFGTQQHQQFIIDASCGIGGQPCGFCQIIGGNGFDQTDRTNGDQISLIFIGVLIFFYHMGDEAKVSLDQDMPGIGVSFLTTFQIHRFFFRCQRFQKGFQISTSENGFPYSLCAGQVFRAFPTKEYIATFHNSEIVLY